MKLLIVVDFQNDFVDGALGVPNASKLEPIIYEKVKTFKANGDDVLFTMDTHRESYLQTQEGRNLPIPHCLYGTKGWELYGRLKDVAEITIQKETFGAEKLFTFLKGKKYEEIELVGLVSNICVISNAIIAKTILPEARIVVDAKATASFDVRLHEEALDVMEGLQIHIINRGKKNEVRK